VVVFQSGVAVYEIALGGVVEGNVVAGEED
jgi:hypothetical protein